MQISLKVRNSKVLFYGSLGLVAIVVFAGVFFSLRALIPFDDVKPSPIAGKTDTTKKATGSSVSKDGKKAGKASSDKPKHKTTTKSDDSKGDASSSSQETGDDDGSSSTGGGSGGGGGDSPTQLVNDGPFIAYGPNSFLRTPLGDNWPVDSTSATGIAYLQANDSNNYPMLRGVGGNQWGVAFALGTCSDPIWKFDATANLPSGQGFLATLGFHAPLGWTNDIPQNNDAPIEIIDTCGNTARPDGFSLWAANVYYDGNSSRILTTNPLSGGSSIVGGSFSHDTNGLDHRVEHSDDTGGLNTTSRGNIPDSFAIRDDLLEYGMKGGNDGTLGYVLQIYLLETDSSMGSVAPLAGFEKNRTGYGAEGERIALKPSWQPPAACTGAARVVARTLQVYGAYIGNNSGSGSSLKVQQNSTLLEPRSLGDCFTWQNMAFVQRGWSASW